MNVLQNIPQSNQQMAVADDVPLDPSILLASLYEEEKDLLEELEDIEDALRNVNCFDDDHGEKTSTIKFIPYLLFCVS